MRFSPVLSSPLTNPRWNNTPDDWQEAGIKDFSGGLCTAFPETNIRDNQFPTLSNWYHEDRSIKTRGPYRPYLVTSQDSILATAPLTFIWVELGDTDYLIVHIDTIVQYWNSTTWTSIKAGLTSTYKPRFVKCSINEAEDLIFCNGKDTPQRWTGSGSSSDLGLAAPSDTTTLATSNSAVTDEQGITLDGKYYYKFTTFYDSSGTNTKYGESGPTASDDITVAGVTTSSFIRVQATLSNCPAIPTGATRNYVYRSPPEESNGPYRRVGYYTSGTDYVDKTPVGEEVEDVPADAGTPPKLKNPLSFKNRIWGIGLNASGQLTNKGVWSADGQPDMFPALNYAYFPDALVGVVAFKENVYWFTEKQIYITPNGDIDTYPRPLKICDIGCTSFDSIIDVGNGLVFQADNNVYWVDFNSFNEKDGDFPFPIGEPIKNKIKDIPLLYKSNSTGCFHEDRYYLSYTGTNQMVNTATLVWDINAGIKLMKQGLYGGWSSLDWKANDIQTFNGTLYSTYNNSKYVMEHDFAGPDDYYTKTEYDATTSHPIITELKTKKFLSTQNPMLVRSMLVQAVTSGATYKATFSFDGGTFEKTKTFAFSTDPLVIDNNWLVWGQGTWGNFNWGDLARLSLSGHKKIPSGGKGRDVQITLTCSDSQDPALTELTFFYKTLPTRLGS